MRVYEPYDFTCPECGARLKPDDSLGLFYCPECRKIFDAGQNRHIAKEKKYYINTLRKSAPDVFTVAAFSYYESVSKLEQRDGANRVDMSNCGRNGCCDTVDVVKQTGFLDRLIAHNEQYERLRGMALNLINSRPTESKRGGSHLARDYESYVADITVPCDLREAVEVSEEMYCRGSSYYNERNYSEAVKNLTSSADMGHTKANYLLAMCYAGGKGVDKDVRKAILYMRRAAEEGDQDAQFELGMIYGNSKLGVKDPYESAKWLRKAAEQGDKRAQGILGVYYLNGIGVEQSDSYAVNWVRKAAAQGFAEAQCMLGAVYADGRGVMKNIPEARTWYKKAIAQGNTLARNQLNSLERELAALRRRREEEERRNRNNYNRTSTYNTVGSGSSYGNNQTHSYGRQTNSYNSSSSNSNRSSNNGSNEGGKINWGIFLLLLFIFPIGALIYAIATRNKKAKTTIGVIIVVIIFLSIIIAAATSASSCSANDFGYGVIYERVL